MKDRKDDADSLMTFAHNIGALAELVSDHAVELIGPQCKFVEKERFLNIKQSSCEPYTQHHEFEGETRLLKRRWNNRMATNNCLVRVWNYTLVYEAENCL